MIINPCSALFERSHVTVTMTVWCVVCVCLCGTLGWLSIIELGVVAVATTTVGVGLAGWLSVYTAVLFTILLCCCVVLCLCVWHVIVAVLYAVACSFCLSLISRVVVVVLVVFSVQLLLFGWLESDCLFGGVTCWMRCSALAVCLYRAGHTLCAMSMSCVRVIKYGNQLTSIELYLLSLLHPLHFGSHHRTNDVVELRIVRGMYLL